MKDSTNMPNSGMGTDADCVTCHGDPAVCASAPGLRHCEKAMRHDAPEDQACEVPLIEQLRSIPRDFRATRAIQWSEDGRETGHQLIAVGYMMHRAANEIAKLQAALSDIGSIRASTLEEAARACERAKVATDRTQADVVHNRACDKCAEDIRNIKNAAPQASVGRVDVNLATAGSPTANAESAPDPRSRKVLRTTQSGTTPNRDAYDPCCALCCHLATCSGDCQKRHLERNG